jgi:NAD-dependent SIR2 family protein deacetylase
METAMGTKKRMQMNQHNMKKAHDTSSDHVFILMSSTEVRCFHCLETISTEEITEWVDGRRTALCPKCGIDALIGDATKFDLDNDLFFGVMNAWYFGDANEQQ